MQRIVLSLLLVLSTLTACTTSPQVPGSVTAAPLLGTWKVDLRQRPGDAPYFQSLVVTAVRGTSFEGTFYGSPMEQARINTDWGAVRIAFVTSDASGAYHHAAVIRDGRLEGLTNSTGRNFLSYWSATKP
jgi:hypothetical protein